MRRSPTTPVYRKAANAAPSAMSSEDMLASVLFVLESLISTVFTSETHTHTQCLAFTPTQSTSPSASSAPASARRRTAQISGGATSSWVSNAFVGKRIGQCPVTLSPTLATECRMRAHIMTVAVLILSEVGDCGEHCNMCQSCNCKQKARRCPLPGGKGRDRAMQNDMTLPGYRVVRPLPTLAAPPKQNIGNPFITWNM